MFGQKKKARVRRKTGPYKQQWSAQTEIPHTHINKVMSLVYGIPEISASLYLQESNMSALTQDNTLIHRPVLISNFTIVNNAIMEHPKLEWFSKMILIYILSRPKNWEVHTWQLASVYQGDKRGNGINAIRTALNELKKYGYVVYKKFQDEKGQWKHRYEVYPEPVDLFQKIFPHIVKPDVVEPDMVEPCLLPITELLVTPETSSLVVPLTELEIKELIQSSSSLPSSPKPITKKEAMEPIEKKVFNIDDACGADDLNKSFSSFDPLTANSSDIIVTKTNGQELRVSLSDVYLFFTHYGPEFTTEEIDAEIKKFRELKGEINNVKRYLLSMCQTTKKQRLKPTQKKEKTKTPRPDYSELPPCGPAVKTKRIGMKAYEDYMENERKKREKGYL